MCPSSVIRLSQLYLIWHLVIFLLLIHFSTQKNCGVFGRHLVTRFRILVFLHHDGFLTGWAAVILCIGAIGEPILASFLVYLVNVAHFLASLPVLEGRSILCSTFGWSHYVAV